MKPHIKLYMKHFGYVLTDCIQCELCSDRAVDIHHIECRGHGGTKRKESIDNLMALCRMHHEQYGDRKQYKHMLKQKHEEILTVHERNTLR